MPEFDRSLYNILIICAAAASLWATELPTTSLRHGSVIALILFAWYVGRKEVKAEARHYEQD